MDFKSLHGRGVKSPDLKPAERSEEEKCERSREGLRQLECRAAKTRQAQEKRREEKRREQEKRREEKRRERERGKEREGAEALLSSL